MCVTTILNNLDIAMSWVTNISSATSLSRGEAADTEEDVCLYPSEKGFTLTATSNPEDKDSTNRPSVLPEHKVEHKKHGTLTIREDNIFKTIHCRVIISKYTNMHFLLGIIPV